MCGTVTGDAGVTAAEAEAVVRQDPLTQALVVVARSRQDRPNLPSTGCPFCPGGIEAPEPYRVHWFKNRWPAMPDDRCEVLLFSPEHDQSLGSLELAQLELVTGLWVARSEALGSRDDVGYVLVFENRGPEVGATIAHPHGQIYAFEDVPPVPLRELSTGTCAICDEFSGKEPHGGSHERRLVTASGGWRAWAVWAPSYPFELLIAPENHIGNLAGAGSSIPGLAAVLQKSLGALDKLFDEPMPYMLWCHQRPVATGQWPTAHVHFHVAPTHRAKGVSRFVASGELGSGIMFNPVGPETAAARLREVSLAGGAR